MNPARWRKPFAFLLLLVLLVPILAACGGTTATPEAAQTPAPAAPAEEPAEEATEPPAAPAEEVTEAPVEEEPEAPAEEVTAATGAEVGEVSPTGEKVLRLAYTGEPDTIDPQKSTFVTENQFVLYNFQPLLTFNPETLTVEAGAAESYEVSEDGKTLTFKLFPDQKYSDGEPLTAANFEYAWKRLCDPGVSGEYSWIAFGVVGCEEYYTAFDTGGLTATDEAELQALRDAVGVRAVDDNTFEISLDEPAPYFANVAALWVSAPAREDIVEADPEAWWQTPDTYIGNGPFKLVEWEPQNRVRWEANENWVGARDNPINLAAVEMTFIAESAVAFEAYRSGEIDMLNVVPEDMATVEADATLKSQLVDQGGTCTFYLAFNNARPPFDNQAIRQAFATALDREGFVRDVLQGSGEPAYSFIRPGVPGHDAEETRWKYDAAKAKQMLTDAGFDFNQEVKLTFSSSQRNQLRYQYLLSRLQENLGVKMSLDPVESTTFTALTKDPQTTPPMYILGWCLDFPDPQNWLSAVFKTGGSAASDISFSNAEFDNLVSQADVLPLDDPKRLELYAQAQDLLVELAPVAFFWYDVNPWLVQPWVTGVKPTVMDPELIGFYDLHAIDIRTE